MKIRVIRVLFLLLTIGTVSACAPATTLGQPTAADSQSTLKAPTSTDVIVTLTFDDGDADNFPVGAILQQYGLHATFFIPSGLVGHSGYMTWDQLHSLQASGNEIGGHSLNHVTVSGLGAKALRHQICDDRNNLIKHGLTPVSFAYPFGSYDPNATSMVKECGYAGARTVRDGPQPFPPADWYAVRAFPYIVSDTDLGKLQRYVNGTRREGGGWVVLIFHHVCDACDYFAVRPDVMNRFIPWLAGQQSQGRVIVKTFAEMLPRP